LLAGVLADVAGGTSPAVISMRFHRGVVNGIVRSAARAAAGANTRHVALAGGVFMNRLVLHGAVRGLAAENLVPLTHVRLPMNDGAVSFGQAVVAWARRHDV
ncbi:MAG: carbamoyltransferase HypF, partial [Actinomycetota bacterium]|nr:carbamoyltransferase HypF [Actinomycetota bacterium]